jgi:hypothetical protein
MARRDVQDEAFRVLYEKARQAGLAAGLAEKPNPMTVVEADPLSGRPLSGGQRWHVPEGLCGFAWVTIRPGTCAFARWLRTNNLARKAYEGGMQIWIHDHNQSIERKEAHAHAMAQVFEAAGIIAYAGSRLD